MMREITTTTTLYSYYELSEEAQERAIEDRRSLVARTFDTDEQEMVGDAIRYVLATRLETPGWDVGEVPEIPGLKIVAWDIERFQMKLDGTLTRDNAPALPWPADCWGARLGATNRTWTDLWLRDEETGERTEWMADYDREDVEAFKEALADAIHLALVAGRDEYEYLTGVELAQEWCEDAGEVFTEDGELDG